MTCCRRTRFSASSVALALKREARIPRISLDRSVIRMRAYAVRLLRLRRIEFSVHTGITDLPGCSSGYLERLTLVGEREPFLSREERAAMQCALDLLSLVSADDSFEHCPLCVINEVIVDRVVSSEHSIDQRPVERVDKDFQIEIG